MTVPGGLLEACARALLVAALLASVAPAIRTTLGRWRGLWLLLLLPLLSPTVATAYVYVERVSPGLQSETLYFLLLAARLLPAAVVVAVLLPDPPMGPAARHATRLLEPSSSALLRGAWVFGPARNHALVAAIVFVLAFQEFDLAVLLNVETWTVWMIDAQTQGLPLSDSLASASVPLLIQAAVLIAGYRLLRRTSEAAVDDRSERIPEPAVGAAAMRQSAIGVACIVLAVFVLALLPAIGLLGGLRSVSGQTSMFGTELRSSVVLAGGATLCASVLANWSSDRFLLILSLPALGGALILGLAVQALFQSPGLDLVYDTPIPLLLGWTLSLAPLVLVLRFALRRLAPQPGLFLSGLLERGTAPAQRRRGARLWFELRGASVGLAGALLFTTAFYELVVGHLLAPSGMSPAAVRLYNLMHYGQNPGLAAMLLMMAGTALGIGALAYLTWRLFGARLGH